MTGSPIARLPSLQVNVASLMRAATGATSDVAFEPGTLPGDDATGTIEGHARLLRTDRGILAGVDVRLEVRLECCRCLEPVREVVECAFDEEFLPVLDVLTGARLRFEDETDAFRIDEHHILDLAEALRQYRVAAEPLAVVCSETCRGICPICGAELNETECSCREPTDPRWAKLQSLVEDQTHNTKDV